MKFKKIKSFPLQKCYAVSEITIAQKPQVIVASEVVDACVILDREGNYKETVWDGPGGTMSLVPVRHMDGAFMASQLFYGPDDSKTSRMVFAKRKSENNWHIKTVANIPHLHRFEILERNGVRYIIACTIKEKTAFEDDWSSPGRVYAAPFPENMDEVNEENPIAFKIIMDGLFKNHGYCQEGVSSAIIAAENGIFKFVPPVSAEAAWEITRILDVPSSDALLIDLDSDGEAELLSITPFHGDNIKLYRKVEGKFKEFFSYHAPFAHAIWAGKLEGVPSVVLGNRLGARDLFWLYDDNGIKIQIIDHNIGPANVICYVHAGKTYIVSCNRETDEVGFYTAERE